MFNQSLLLQKIINRFNEPNNLSLFLKFSYYNKAQLSNIRTELFKIFVSRIRKLRFFEMCKICDEFSVYKNGQIICNPQNINVDFLQLYYLSTNDYYKVLLLLEFNKIDSFVLKINTDVYSSENLKFLFSDLKKNNYNQNFIFFYSYFFLNKINFINILLFLLNLNILFSKKLINLEKKLV